MNMHAGKEPEKLVFGPAVTYKQAWLRLQLLAVSPDMLLSWGNLHHLHGIAKDLDALPEEADLDLAERVAMLSIPEIRWLEQYSFKRDQPLATIQWAHVPSGLEPWNEIMPVGDDAYHWWQLSRAQQQPSRPSRHGSVVIIEMNTRFMSEDTAQRFNAESTFVVGWVTDEEWSILLRAFHRLR